MLLFASRDIYTFCFTSVLFTSDCKNLFLKFFASGCIKIFYLLFGKKKEKIKGKNLNVTRRIFSFKTLFFVAAFT